MSIPSVGMFVYTDAGHDLVVTVHDDDGVPINVTAATDIHLVWRAPDGTTGDQTGAIEAPGINGQFRFTSPGTWKNPGQRTTVYLEFGINWLIGAERTWARELRRLEIARMP